MAEIQSNKKKSRFSIQSQSEPKELGRNTQKTRVKGSELPDEN